MYIYFLGTRLKESGFINKSLLTLGTVISKLSSAGEEGFVVAYTFANSI